MGIQKPGLKHRSQSGVALFISLILLLVLTIIGVSSVQTTSLEVRMTRNHHDSTLAFQAAESALRDAEAEIMNVVSIVDFNDTGPLFTVADLGVADRWEQANVWTTNASEVAATAVAGVVAQPRYIIEHAASVVLLDASSNQQDNSYGDGDPSRIEVFRITARGVGGTDNAEVLLQSSFGRIID